MKVEIDEARVKAQIDAEVAKGFTPRPVVFPPGKEGPPECRICLGSSGPFWVLFFGRELPERQTYVYCTALTCGDCARRPERTAEFLDRVELRYNWLEAHGKN